MFTKPPPASGHKMSAATRHAEPGLSPGPADWTSTLADAERTCCCSARPVVLAVLPARAGQSRPVGLLLCGHHFRSSRTALAEAGAVIHRLPPP
jgi:hypothetical protein